MEEIFKSLSESVSEQCYDEIMGLVEELLNENTVEQIKKVHGYPEYDTTERGELIPKNKAAKLTKKTENLRQNAVNQKRQEGVNKGVLTDGNVNIVKDENKKYIPKNFKDLYGTYAYPSKFTKNKVGEYMTRNRKETR